MTGGLRIGQRVNFWGSQWESQVINGQYFAANPSFKGWSGALTGPDAAVPCECYAHRPDFSVLGRKTGTEFPTRPGLAFID